MLDAAVFPVTRLFVQYDFETLDQLIPSALASRDLVAHGGCLRRRLGESAIGNSYYYHICIPGIHSEIPAGNSISISIPISEFSD